MPLLKNLMQMASLSLCKAYQKNYRALPRIASFIGTSNRKDLLTDPTGSRRFICVEVEHPIDCEAIEHEQLYAQLKVAILSGQRYWFTKEEEQELQKAIWRFTVKGQWKMCCVLVIGRRKEERSVIFFLRLIYFNV